LGQVRAYTKIDVEKSTLDGVLTRLRVLKDIAAEKRNHKLPL